MERLQIPKKLSHPETSLNFLSQAKQHLELAKNQSKHIQRDKSPTFSSISKRVKIFVIFRGNYFVKDLTELLVEPAVKPSDFIYTKFVTTVVLIIPKTSVE